MAKSGYSREGGARARRLGTGLTAPTVSDDRVGPPSVFSRKIPGLRGPLRDVCLYRSGIA